MKPHPLYPPQDPQALGRYYTDHVLGMTEAGLDSNAEIAGQLAWRDKLIRELMIERDEHRDKTIEQRDRLAVLSRIVRRALASHQLEKLEDARRFLDDEAEPPRRWAEAFIESGFIVISVPASVLPDALAQNPRDDSYYNVTITDVAGFARDVVRELNAEAEDGTTAIHAMFDRAMADAIDNGSEHVEIDEKKSHAT